jgi:tRNA threonylcarbamoyladenosine biosynthesis protein TsaB
MPYFLAIQSTYHAVELGLFDSATLRGSTVLDKIIVSSLLIPTVDKLLASHSLSLNKLDFIAGSLGPAPFTTLRVAIASINGIHAASNIPIIGITAFDAMFAEWHTQVSTTCILLNAFSNDVYWAIKRPHDKESTHGYGSIADVITQLHGVNEQIRLIGNAAQLHLPTLQAALNNSFELIPMLPQTSSLPFIGLLGLARWQAKDYTNQPLVPLYLKSSSAKLQRMQ